MRGKDEKKAKGPRFKTDDIKGDRAERLGQMIENVGKAYKKNLFFSAADDLLLVSRVPTGLYGLNVATNGGWPIGRISMAYGPKHGGKTTLFLRGLGNMQRLCGSCYRPAEFERGIIRLPDLRTGKIIDVETNVISGCECGKPKDVLALVVDAEGAWMKDWADKMGVWSNKVIIIRPSYGEQAYNIVTSFIAGHEIDLTIIDSLAQLTPEAELTAAMEEQHQGLAARVNNKFFRKLVSGLNDAFCDGAIGTVWLINQYREKIGVMFGSPDVVTGGKGQGFVTSIEVEMRPGKVNMDDESGEPLSGVFHYDVKKNKVGVSRMRGEFTQCMADTDVFKIGDLMEHEYVIGKAAEMGFVSHPNNVTYEFGGEKFRGVSQMVRYFAEHKTEFEKLCTDMLNIRLGIAPTGDSAE